jgi:hypothetical protein
VHSELDRGNDGSCNVREFAVVLTTTVRKSHIATAENRRDAGIRRGKIVYVESRDRLPEDPGEEPTRTAPMGYTLSKKMSSRQAPTKSGVPQYDEASYDGLDSESNTQHTGQSTPRYDNAEQLQTSRDVASVPAYDHADGSIMNDDQVSASESTRRDDGVERQPSRRIASIPVYDQAVEDSIEYDLGASNSGPHYDQPVGTEEAAANIAAEAAAANSTTPTIVVRDADDAYEESRTSDEKLLYGDPTDGDDLPPLPGQSSNAAEDDEMVYADLAGFNRGGPTGTPLPSNSDDDNVLYAAVEPFT